MSVDQELDSRARGESSPAVSVIVPTYNRSAMVRRAAESVRRQTYVDWELVIVDDASIEDVAAGVASLLGDDPRIRLVRRSVTGGPSAARNTGLREARGRFVCFLDDDDEFIEGKLEHQVQQLQAAPHDIAGVTGAADGAGAPPKSKQGLELSELHRDHLFRLPVRGQPLIGSHLLRREAVEEIGGFDESLPSWEDWDFYVRLLERYRIIPDRVAVMTCHDHPGRVTRSAPARQGWPLVFDKYRDEISQDRALHAAWRSTLAWKYLGWGQPKEARQHAAAALRLAPANPRGWYLVGTTLVGARPRRWLTAGYRRLGALRGRLRPHRAM